VRVSLGGVRDEADIRGHRKTYIGAMPGRIMTALSDAGTDNPLILLDEIDKLTRDAHGDPSAALLEVLDPDQNISFRDHFIEIPYDLSDCLFIATANTLETIPKPLLDRMEVIEMKSYTRAEKLSIAKNHLLGKQLEKHGMNRRMVKIDDQAMLEIIDHYTREAGVRGLEREIAAICRKVAKKMVENPDKKSYKITKEDLFSYLGPQKVMDETLSPCDEVGVVNGLAYTEAGGDLLKVEAVSFGGTGKLELTGSLGDVMVESAKIALSVVRSRAKEWEISPDFYKNTDIHIHFPEGAVPKDGPSAGVTMVTALISELSGRPVRRDIAMTGEVTLHGKVLAIGGLREKTMAAYQAGIQTVFIPNENRQDYDRLDDFIKEGMNFVFCRTVDDVLSQALSDRQIELEKEKKISTVSPVYLSERNTSDSEFCQNNA
jgi:ATP-dependent Lon protease